jgi:peroxiredoxin
MSSKLNKNSKETSAPSGTESKGLTQKQKNYIYTGIFFTIIIFLFIVNNYNGEPEEGPYPPHYLESMQNYLRLSDYRDKVVLLCFWTTWNENSRKIMPELVSLKDSYKESEFEIIGVALDAATRSGKTKENLATFIEEYGINYPVVYGKSKTISDFGGLPSLPAIFIIDKNGKIIAHHQGKVSKAVLINDINTAMQGTDEEGSLMAPDFNLPRANNK